MNVYHELIGVDPFREEVYFLLDEIHVYKGWQLELKYYMDSYAKCRFIISGSSKTLLYSDASERLGVDRETLKLDLYYLQSSMMVFIADVYTPSNKAVEKREKKLYFWEEGLRRALTLDKDEGKTAENVVAWHLIKKGYELKPFFRPFYWKNKHEVDFVYNDAQRLIPVEVKYKQQIKASDAKGLIEFLDLYGSNIGIVVTKDIFKKEKIGGYEILFIPVWFFLMVI